MLKKGTSGWDLPAWKGLSVLCNTPGGAAQLQQCRCCPGFSWSLAAPGTKPVASNGAKKCGHTIIQELLCVTQDSELVLESLKALTDIVFPPLCCFILLLLPFYCKETPNTLQCHKILSTYAESKAHLAEKSHVKQVIQNAFAVKS